MTTISLRGSSVSFFNNNAQSVSGAELVVVANTANAAMTYRITGRDEDNIPFIDPTSPVQEVRLNGQNLTLLEDTGNVRYQIAQVSWGGGTSIVLLVTLDTGGGSRDFFFGLGGDALPIVRTMAQWNAFNTSITGAVAPGGAFGPNKPIEWRSMTDAQLTHDDEFYGTPGRDNHIGGIGDDFFGSSAGNDTFSGGLGQDQVSYQRDPRAVTVDLVAGTGRDGFGNTDQLISIEDVRGSAFADRISGNAGANMFRGLEGRDTIDGRGGRDTVRYDRDENYGGMRGVTVDLSRNRAVDGFGDVDTILNIEDVWGSRFNDRLDGNFLGNELDGLGGHDRLRGFGGNDRLIGGNGNDTLDGGLGNDLLMGGRGADVFLFSGSFGRDRILDWDSSDRIDLRGVIGITGFNDLRANHLVQNGDSSVIRVNSSSTITVFGVRPAEFAADDFLF